MFTGILHAPGPGALFCRVAAALLAGLGAAGSLIVTYDIRPPGGGGPDRSLADCAPGREYELISSHNYIALCKSVPIIYILVAKCPTYPGTT